MCNRHAHLVDPPVSEEVEEIARRTFAIADELQQVRKFHTVAYSCTHHFISLLFSLAQSVKLQQERSERLKRVEVEIKALKP